MGITFAIDGVRTNYEDPDSHLNLNVRNAADLLVWLGYESFDMWDGGALDALGLAARCRARLALEPRNVDPALPGREYRANGGTGARVVEASRAEGYLMDRAADLLALCERAGAGRIRYY